MSGKSLSSSARRIQKELAEISLEPPTNCSAGPKGDNLYEWVSTIVGPSGGFEIRARERARGRRNAHRRCVVASPSYDFDAHV